MAGQLSQLPSAYVITAIRIHATVLWRFDSFQCPTASQRTAGPHAPPSPSPKGAIVRLYIHATVFWRRFAYASFQCHRHAADSGPQRPVLPPLPKPPPWAPSRLKYTAHRAPPRNCKKYRKSFETPREPCHCHVSDSGELEAARRQASSRPRDSRPPHCPPPPLETKPPTPPSTGSTFRGRGRGCSAPQNPRTRRPRRHRPAWHAAGGPPDR